MSSARWCEVDVPADHPAFDGHFPGAPVLPGALLASLMLEALAQDAATAQHAGAPLRIDEIKFLAPVAPGTRLRIGVTPAAGGAGFELRRGDVLVARGRVSPAAPP